MMLTSSTLEIPICSTIESRQNRTDSNQLQEYTLHRPQVLLCRFFQPNCNPNFVKEPRAAKIRSDQNNFLCLAREIYFQLRKISYPRGRLQTRQDYPEVSRHFCGVFFIRLSKLSSNDQIKQLHKLSSRPQISNEEKKDFQTEAHTKFPQVSKNISIKLLGTFIMSKMGKQYITDQGRNVHDLEVTNSRGEYTIFLRSNRLE